MKRRTVLASLGTLSAFGAGCVAPTNGFNNSTPDAPTGSEEPVDDSNPDTMSPAPTPPGTYGDDPAGPVVKNRETVTFDIDTESPVFVEPQKSTVEDVDSIGFTLRNIGNDSFGWNPCDWGLFHFTNGSWRHIAPDLTPQPYSDLPGGQTHQYNLVIGQTTPSVETDYCGLKEVEALSPGLYAFCLYGSYNGEDQKTYVARFECSPNDS